MKYVDCLLVLCIINFQQISTTVKTDKEVFVRFRTAMPKGRFVKLNDNLRSAFHTSILPQIRFSRNAQCPVCRSDPPPLSSPSRAALRCG
jgi:hypothetical protein